MPPGMQIQWQPPAPDPRIVQTLSQQLGVIPLIARLLAVRGIQSANQASRFMNPTLSSLTAPSQMAGMAAAVDRIRQALTGGEKILVFGDYDADGITATAALVTFLRRCGATVVYHIPHRIVDGYGLNTDFIAQRAQPAGIDLIVTVDCGSASGEAVALGRRLGIDTIVTDHHPIHRLPDAAVAVVNPTRSDCPAGLGHLAGVGVAFYLIIALRSHLRESGYWQGRREPNLKKFCDLVALGTVADVAPLIGENRALTAAGLDQINRRHRPGIAALTTLIAAPDEPVDAETIAYRLAPRLNAAGRLAHARMACELLLTENRRKAEHLARTLCRLNSRRQAMENELMATIGEGLRQRPDHLDRPVLVVDGSGWHEGILGIVAARLMRQYQRPAVVLSVRNGLAKGSARSLDGIDVAAALTQCTDLLDRFGGHPLAAGLALPSARIEAFRTRLETIITRLAEGREPSPALAVDARVPLAEINPDLMAQLQRLAPFGPANPSPLFLATGIRVRQSRTVGDRHRQMVLTDDSARGGIPAIQFNVEGPLENDCIGRIAYRPQWNYWNGRKRLQLIVEATDAEA